MKDVVIDHKTAAARVFSYESLKPCDKAFVDARIPGHEGKKNYSIIGIGVSQSKDQFVNLTEAHGFNIGAVELPPGNINGLHYHYTSEVFMVQSGVWELFWGPRGENGIVLNPMTIATIPTWLFRGFKNIEEGFIFSALGGDDTGGVVWHPENMILGRKNGVYLLENNRIVDTVAGESLPEDVKPMDILSNVEVQSLRNFNVEEMSPNVMSLNRADFSSEALLDSCLNGHRAYLAPAIGWGLTMNREHAPNISRPHTFTIEWLRIPPGNSVSPHRIEESQVLLVLDGECTLRYNRSNAEDRPFVTTAEKGCFSIPCNAWREFCNQGNKDMLAIIVSGKDGRKLIEWEQEVVEAANLNGWMVDPGSYIASAHITKYMAK